jgi:transcriptional regulator with XRE-family HTH domain
MTTAEQLGDQIKAAREEAGLSLRKLGELAKVPTTTIESYESGISVPSADRLARIAVALNYYTFRVDEYTFTVRLADAAPEKQAANAQLPLDFSGEYSYAKAMVKIRPGRISVVFDGVKASTQRPRLTASSN